MLVLVTLFATLNWLYVVAWLYIKRFVFVPPLTELRTLCFLLPQSRQMTETRGGVLGGDTS